LQPGQRNECIERRRLIGLQAEPDYLKACTGILHDTPQTSRQWVKWDPDHIERVAAEINHYEFLHGYSFE
jgi:hypothetical protein